MEVRFVPLELARLDALRLEAIFLPFCQDERPLRGAAGLCDWRLCGDLSDLLLGGRVTGTLGELTLRPGRPRLPFEKLLLLGCGPRETFDEAAARAVTARLVDAARGLRLRAFACAVPGRAVPGTRAGELARWFLAGLEGATELEEVVIVDDLDAQRAMVPVVEAERRRARAADPDEP